MRAVAAQLSSNGVLPPVAVAAAMVLLATLTHFLGGPGAGWLVFAYTANALVAVFVAVLIWLFIRVAILAKECADHPLPIAWAQLKPKLPLLILPGLVLPIFLGSFTATKIAIPELVGFHYDPLFAKIDIAIFGIDPWRVAHWIVGPFSQILELIYVPVWAAILAYSTAFVVLYCERRFVLTFATAMMLTWLVGGFALAYAFSSAGPLFTGLNGLEAHFADLKLALLDSGFLTGSIYLEKGVAEGGGYLGGGISAMPSMHIGTCTVYCMAARKTRWYIPSLLFLAVIFVGSVYSGFHYAIDAPVAAFVAILCWKTSETSIKAYHGSIDEGVS